MCEGQTKCAQQLFHTVCQVVVVYIWIHLYSVSISINRYVYVCCVGMCGRGKDKALPSFPSQHTMPLYTSINQHLSTRGMHQYMSTLTFFVCVFVWKKRKKISPASLRYVLSRLARKGWLEQLYIWCMMYEDMYEYELMRIYIFIYLCTYE